MERCQTYSIEPIKCIRLSLRNYRTRKTKEFDLHQGDFVSILYIDSLNAVGEGKEYQIDGRVIDIKEMAHRSHVTTRDDFNIREIPNCIAANLNLTARDINSRFEIVLDCSGRMQSKTMCLNAYNILDIEKFPYKFNLDEDPELVPRIIDGFVVNEMKTPQQIDIEMGSFRLNDRVFGEE